MRRLLLVYLLLMLLTSALVDGVCLAHVVPQASESLTAQNDEYLSVRLSTRKELQPCAVAPVTTATLHGIVPDLAPGHAAWSFGWLPPSPHFGSRLLYILSSLQR
jgi:hypothetical protein